MLGEIRNLWRTRVRRKPPRNRYSRLDLPWRREGAFSVRAYESYEGYRDHQAAKLPTLNLEDYDTRYRQVLGERLSKLPFLPPGSSVLCLAARIGTECKAFLDQRCFAVGIDLNPGDGNRYVVHGDFHQLQFADSSVDCVFTNSLDHAFDLDRIVREVARVLKPRGVFLAEIVAGTEDEAGREPGRFEALWWERLESVVQQIADKGFHVEHRESFTFPWRGEQVAFRSLKSKAA